MLWNESQRLRRRHYRENCHYVIKNKPLRDRTETNLVGYIEQFTIDHDSLTVRGWAMAGRLLLRVGDRQHVITCRVDRPDVWGVFGQRNGVEKPVGFDITVPATSGNIELVADDPDGTMSWKLPRPGWLRAAVERVRMDACFFLRCGYGLPLGIKYLLTERKQADRERLQRILGLVTSLPRPLALDSNLFGKPGTAQSPQAEITIIFPVYNAFEVCVEAINRIERHTDLAWHLIAIEDASTDPRVRPWLRQWTSKRIGHVTLLENPQNLGFIGSVNRGLSRASDREGPVVLLNSDALVPAGWASRLIQPILANHKVASVTPMSNDATILSVPTGCAATVLPAGVADQIDRVACSFSNQAHVEIPTGVGFCMAMSRNALSAVPQFDPSFGKGYGEEVDWCQRVSKLGHVHLGIGNLFVEHRGGASFGSERKQEALKNASDILNARYPDFDADVQGFLATDSLITARLSLGLASAALTQTEAPHVYLAHSLGGGANNWLEQQIASRTASGQASIVLRVGGKWRFHVELYSGGGCLKAGTDDIDTIKTIIGHMQHRRIIYSCGVGDPAPWELPPLLCNLARGAELEILFHDYFPISPSFNLLNEAGIYQGVPHSNDTDPAHQIATGIRELPLTEWRCLWTNAIRQADQLTVFSEASRKIVVEIWPDETAKIKCRPHEKPQITYTKMKQDSAKKGAIAVLGAIGKVKGAESLSDLAHHLDRIPNAPELIIIGEFDHSFSLPVSVFVTGRYDMKTLPEILKRHQIKAWLMPSIWPETYSFTTHEMLATGLPVMGFDIGAQGDAIRAADNGILVANDSTDIYNSFCQITAGASSRRL